MQITHIPASIPTSIPTSILTTATRHLAHAALLTLIVTAPALSQTSVPLFAEIWSASDAALENGPRFERADVAAAEVLTQNTAPAGVGVATSFEDLRTKLRAGDRVIVRDERGDTARGTVSSLTEDEIEIEWRRWFRLRQRAFTEASVRRIEIEDSTLNGKLIGLAVGVAGVVVASNTCKSDNCIGALMASSILLPVIGAAVGRWVDLSIKRTVYVSPGGTATAISPIRGPRHLSLSLMARIPF